jgi:hypothetical protein
MRGDSLTQRSLVKDSIMPLELQLGTGNVMSEAATFRASRWLLSVDGETTAARERDAWRNVSRGM